MSKGLDDIQGVNNGFPGQKSEIRHPGVGYNGVDGAKLAAEYRDGPSLVFVSVTSPTKIAFGYYTRDVGIILALPGRLLVLPLFCILTVYGATFTRITGDWFMAAH